MPSPPFFAALVTLVVLGIGGARGEPRQIVWTDGETAMVRVRYADLDLSTPGGAEAILRRIRRAAVLICGPEPADRLSFQRQYDACVRETVNRAVIGLGRLQASPAGATVDTLADNQPR
jgi:UrcA family protein